MAPFVINPEIQSGDYVVVGQPRKGKAVWKVQERQPTQATIKEIWIGTMRYSIDVRKLIKVDRQGNPLAESPGEGR